MNSEAKKKFLLNCQELTFTERSMGRIAASRALFSKDTTKVGATIFKDGDFIASGHNLLSSGVDVKSFQIDESNKSDYTLHAEMNAITFAARQGRALEGSNIIITGKCPCCDCAKAIIASGIKRVICPKPDTNSRWSKMNEKALKLFEVAEVNVVLVEELAGTEIGLTCPTKYIV